MKNKGFTLVELLAVLVVLSILAVITVPRITNSISNSKDKVEETQKRQIFKAAEDYIAMHLKDYNEEESTCFDDKGNEYFACITLGRLIEEGFIEPNYVKKSSICTLSENEEDIDLTLIKNPKTNNYLPNSLRVFVTSKSNGTYEYKLEEINNYEDDLCNKIEGCQNCNSNIKPIELKSYEKDINIGDDFDLEDQYIINADQSELIKPIIIIEKNNNGNYEKVNSLDTSKTGSYKLTYKITLNATTYAVYQIVNVK